MTEQTDGGAGIELVLEHLKQTRAFDFTGYKRGTLTRRIEKRMDQVGVASPADYVDYLEVHPEEFEPLFNTILINVTSFFRDTEAWEALRDVVVPEIVARDRTPIRVWSAGCSSGQEAYSAVMLLADAIGIEGVKERVKVYATDVDEEALEQARLASYTAREMESVPPEMAERYFDQTGSTWTLNPELRRAVIFGRHDLLQDAPISRVDLLLCRNTLMYFNAEVQTRLVQGLHFSLAPDGYLLLGKVEMLLGRGELFESVDVKRRLFRKLIPATLRGRLLALAGADAAQYPLDGPERIVDAAFEHAADPQLVLDANGILIAVNARARSMFGLPPEVVGRPFQDLEISYRAVGRAVRLSEVPRWTPSGELTVLDIGIAPLSADGEHLGVTISFIDVTRHRQLQEELEQTHRELEVAYEELQSANEELETTNEELQSTIEELETTNEELQSTNEELETMNEELSSTNEELHAINDELRDRTSEVDQVNGYLESILTGLHASVIVLDTELLVRIWNGRSLDMWGVRSEEVEGRPFLSLDIGFPVTRLREPLLAILAGEQAPTPLMAEATSRRGQQIRCMARVNPLTGIAGKVEGAIVILEELQDA